MSTLVAAAALIVGSVAVGADRPAAATKPAVAAPAPSAPVSDPLAATAAAALLPGIIAKDVMPAGCVSCHAGPHVMNKDLAAIKHKNVDAKVKVLPTDCGSCHKPGAEVGGLAQVTHLAHYSGGEKSKFVREYGGQCLHCHAIDLESGDPKIKSGPRNW
jgi:cytochrome c5